MTTLKAGEVRRFTERPDLTSGIFLIYGPDTGLVRETAQDLIRSLSKGGAELVTFEGSELDNEPARLAIELRTPSLFGEKRLVRVRGASKALVPTLSEISPDDGAVVLEAGNLPPRDPLRLLAETARRGRALPCYADTDESLGRVIAEAFSAAGIRLEQNALAALKDTLGNDREVTRRELEKLTLYAAEAGILTAADVAALCADNAALLMDEVLDATGTGHAARAEEALTRAIAAQVNPQQLLSSALSHFAMLRRWRTELDSGRTARNVLDGARPKPHFSRRAAMEQQLRLWSDLDLAGAADRLQAAIAESRRNYDLQETIARRTFLALAVTAAER